MTYASGGARSDSCEKYRGGSRPRFGKGLCGRCGSPVDITQYNAKHRSRWCKACHRAFMRDLRTRKALTPEQKFKDNARSYAGIYLRRGKIERKPCSQCGSTAAQMHHHDYRKPLEVEWLCRPCHLRKHHEEDTQMRGGTRS